MNRGSAAAYISLALFLWASGSVVCLLSHSGVKSRHRDHLLLSTEHGAPSPAITPNRVDSDPCSIQCPVHIQGFPMVPSMSLGLGWGLRMPAMLTHCVRSPGPRPRTGSRAFPSMSPSRPARSLGGEGGPLSSRAWVCPVASSCCCN